MYTTVYKQIYLPLVTDMVWLVSHNLASYSCVRFPTRIQCMLHMWLYILEDSYITYNHKQYSLCALYIIVLDINLIHQN
jgi:hypothetical protein